MEEFFIQDKIMSGINGINQIDRLNNSQASQINLNKVNGGSKNYYDTFIFGKSGMSAVDRAGDSAQLGTVKRSVSEIQNELTAKKNLRTSNQNEITKLSEELEKLQQLQYDKMEEADKLEADYKRKLESEQHNYEKSVQRIKEHQMDLYIESKSGIGKGMQEDELWQRINNAIPDAPKPDTTMVSQVESLRAEAYKIQSDIAGINADIDAKTLENQKLDIEIPELEAELEAAKAQQQTSNSGATRGSGGNGGSSGGGAGDPIGFDFDGEKYDFIVDDGDFDSTSDFLGAENAWEAMEKLDVDGNGTVDMNELKEGNIKLVKMNGDQKEIVDVNDKRFGSGMSIDLNTYKSGSEGASNELLNKIDTKDNDGDGIKNQSLLGTFKINIDGQTHEGYNTWDDTDYLSDTFKIANNPKSNLFAPVSSAPVESNSKNKFSSVFSNATNPASNIEAEAQKAQADMRAIKQEALMEVKEFAQSHKNDENENEQQSKKQFKNIFMFNQ